MSKDRIFRNKKKLVEKFNFGKETTKVFDDMLHRSVPFYDETQRQIKEIASEFAVPGTNIYDLGCSTAASFLSIHKSVPPDVTFIGTDNSKEMLEKAEKNLKRAKFSRKYELLYQDLNKEVVVKNASVVILNLTLQFVRPLYRQRVISSIASGINKGGCLILVEKVLSQHSTLNSLFIKFYYDFKKRNGYTEMEIAQKREALENVLVPYHFDENRELLLNNGFKGVDIFFRWYNFCGMLAIK